MPRHPSKKQPRRTLRRAARDYFKRVRDLDDKPENFQVIVAVLREAGRPLRAREIVDLAGERLLTASKQPYNVVARDLCRDINQYGPRSTVVRIATGLFAIRDSAAASVMTTNGGTLVRETVSAPLSIPTGADIR